MRQEELVDSVIVDATIYNPGGTHLGAFPGPLFGAFRHNDNPEAAQVTRWTQWNIDLKAFADQGVNLANVNSSTLGLSSVTGGTGIMYFDDIRLYQPAQ